MIISGIESSNLRKMRFKKTRVYSSSSISVMVNFGRLNSRRGVPVVIVIPKKNIKKAVYRNLVRRRIKSILSQIEMGVNSSLNKVSIIINVLDYNIVSRDYVELAQELNIAICNVMSKSARYDSKKNKYICNYSVSKYPKKTSVL